MSASSESIHQHPLAYLLGLEGVALLRAFAGEHDRDFTRARIADIRDLLRRADEFGDGTDVPLMATARGYDGWAATYDGEPNGAFPLQDDVLLPVLDTLIPGLTVDAACGTGRISRELIRRGHRVLGFDISAGMLARARVNVPGAAFALGDYTALPLDAGCADHIVCTLALSHLDDLGPFFAEAARVLKPGGHLVITDVLGHCIGSRNHPLVKWDVDDQVGYVPNWQHTTGEYLRAALRHGFSVRGYEEQPRPARTVEPDEKPELLDLSEPPDVWSLHPWVPAAANAARAGLPALVLWDLERLAR